MAQASVARLLASRGPDAALGQLPTFALSRVTCFKLSWQRLTWVVLQVDAAHDDTYHECLETNDYLGCLEVVNLPWLFLSFPHTMSGINLGPPPMSGADSQLAWPPQVVSSSLSRVSRAADRELYQRVYAQVRQPLTKRCFSCWLFEHGPGGVAAPQQPPSV